jgi:hypothetical protein
MTADAQIRCILPLTVEPTGISTGDPEPERGRSGPVQAGGWLRETTQSRRQEPITQAAR